MFSKLFSTLCEKRDRDVHRICHYLCQKAGLGCVGRRIYTHTYVRPLEGHTRNFKEWLRLRKEAGGDGEGGILTAYSCVPLEFRTT